MRKALIFCTIMFIILAAAPLLTSYISKDNRDFKKTESTSISVKNAIDEDYIFQYTASITDENFCDEGLKAALSIAKNNTRYFETEGKERDNIPTEVSSKELLNRIKNLYNDVDVSIEYKSEIVYIPVSSLSVGFTKADETYPYMESVASPWDTFNEKFIYDKDYSAGVSMEGINYLCNEKMSYKEALKWYLPEFDIK